MPQRSPTHHNNKGEKKSKDLNSNFSTTKKRRTEVMVQILEPLLGLWVQYYKTNKYHKNKQASKEQKALKQLHNLKIVNRGLL
jgi:hypothetical protein